MRSLLNLFLLARLLTASATCYHPDGSAIFDSAFQPCTGSAMCCATNRVTNADQCLQNGLCTGGGNLFRDSCTDPTWQSPSCLQLCIAGTDWSGSITAGGVNQTINYAQHDVQVTSCGDGSYCCGQANNTCCDRGQGIPIAFAISPATTTITSSSTITTALTTSSLLPLSTIILGTTIILTGIGAPTTSASVNSTTPSSGSSNSSGSGLSTGARVGIGVGCGIVALAVVGAALLLWSKRRSRRTIAPLYHSEKDGREVHGNQASEMAAPHTAQEMWEREPFVELDATPDVPLRELP